MEDSKQDLFTAISPTSQTTRCTKKKWILVAVAVIGAIVIPIAITQLRNKNKGEKSRVPSSSETLGDTETAHAATTPRRNNSSSNPATYEPIVAFNTPKVPTTAPTLLDSSTSSELSSVVGTKPILGNASGTPYLHCDADPNVVREELEHIVLLHGAYFAKEVWIQTGILQQFCDQPAVTATALDMSYGTHKKLKTILDALVANNAIQLPVVLVTPSAGGSAIVDWMINGNVNLLHEYVSVWVPVAVGSLKKATDAQVQGIVPMEVLAIYGDGDNSGEQSSQRLSQLVDATVVEFEGGHPVYRDQPDEFAGIILEYLGVDHEIG